MVWRPGTQQLIGASAGHDARLQSKGITTRPGTQSHLLVIPRESFVFALSTCGSVYDKHTLHLPALGQGNGSQGEQAHYILLWLCAGVALRITAVDFCGNSEHDEKMGLIIW